MKKIWIFIFVVTVLLAACSSDGDGGAAAASSEVASVHAETFDDLPNCSKSREGDLAEVQDERKAYRCQKGAWEFDHDVLDTVKTEDDLPACTGRKEGLSLFVQFEHAAYTCDGMRWGKEEKGNADSGIAEYESEDDLPSCSDNREGSLALIDGDAYLCEDKHWNDKGAYYVTIDSLANCTAKRNGEKVYIADEGTTLKCVDGEWISNAKNSSSSISKTSESAEGTLTDSRDGQTYKTVTIGAQTWMAENLNYETTGSYCYRDSAKYCATYGRLYLWAAAMDSAGTWSSNGKGCGISSVCSPKLPVRGACPKGWHLPDTTEWNILFATVGGGSMAGTKLKSQSGWYDGGNGDDAFDFAALPAGNYYYGNSYDCSAGSNAYFWSSTKYNVEGTYIMRLYYSADYANISDTKGSNGFSVRCLKDSN